MVGRLITFLVLLFSFIFLALLAEKVSEDPPWPTKTPPQTTTIP